jgi:CubicO group peptidase (beta-lactamase class C family)
MWFALLLLLAQPRDVGELLKPIREKHDMPGLAAVLVDGEKVTMAGAVGIRKRGADDALTIDDKFHLGSCTKSMTATMIATLVADGKLKWTSTVGEVFDDVKDMHADWKGVTLEQLLTNSGGAPAGLDADGLWGRLWAHKGTPTEARRKLVEGVVRRAPEAPPGTKFIYSNGGFSIAGAMAEKATGKAWEDLMRERVFEPLGMSSAGFGAPGTRDTIDQPRGHTAKGAAVEPGPGSDNPVAIGPAGIVHASLGDWSKYVSLHVRGAKHSKCPKALTAELFEKIHAPALGNYAMGWGRAKRDWGGTVLTHSGSNTMWFCVTWLSPSRDFAVLVATNQGGDAAAKACDEAAWALIQKR